MHQRRHWLCLIASINHTFFKYNLTVICVMFRVEFHVQITWNVNVSLRVLMSYNDRVNAWPPDLDERCLQVVEIADICSQM